MKRMICVLSAAILLMSNVLAYGENARVETEETQLIEDIILYYGGYGEAADEKIDELLKKRERINYLTEKKNLL